MKIAVLGDVHANWVALQAVAADIDAWRPDMVFALGDIVNRGPRPVECLRFIIQREREAGWRTVRGNHEDYVISVGAPDVPREGPVFAITQHSHWTRALIEHDLGAIHAWPFARHVRLQAESHHSQGRPRGGQTVQLVHASLAGNRAGIYVRSSDSEVAALAARPQPNVLVCGHTHRAMCRQVDDMLVVNTGSAGLPFDRDWHPSYARLTLRRGRWDVKLTRLAYDREAAARDFELSGCLSDGGPLVPLMVAELWAARSHIAEWQRTWEEAVLTGAISAEASVARYLENVV